MVLDKFAIYVCLVTLGFVGAVEEFVVKIPQGSLKGIKSTTVYLEKPMYSFKGIPYAKPNMGPNKFRLPEPAEPWNGVLDATKHRSICPGYCFMKQRIRGYEDCLYLNVYTPEVNQDAKKAVMVFIHGSGFNSDSGNDEYYGADFFVENDVVFVTINYRLGALGFLSTGDAVAPGNAGLKDQVLALKWVKNNIERFGGDADRVTIFGHSAAGGAILYHMLSPMSQDLFKNAILQSGSIGSWICTFKPREAAFMLGEALGIKTTDSAELVKKLAEFSYKELVEASAEISKKTLNVFGGSFFAFVPSVEGDFGQEIFLSADPWELMISGKMADVPVLTGLTADEGEFLGGMLVAQASLLQDNFDLFIPNDLNMTDPAQRKATGESIEKFFFNGKPISEDTKAANELFGDILFNYGSLITSKIINERNTAPVYEYQFNFVNPLGFEKAFYKVETGAAHGDDLVFQFYSGYFKNKPVAGTPEAKMVQIMTELWTNFAKESNPTPNTDGVVKVKWEPKGEEDNYLEIDVEPVMKKGMFKERISFWADMYKNVLGDYSKLFA